MGLLRLFIAWRLLRICLPLIVSAALLLTISSSLRGLDIGRAGVGRGSAAGAVSGVLRVRFTRCCEMPGTC